MFYVPVQLFLPLQNILKKCVPMLNYVDNSIHVHIPLMLLMVHCDLLFYRWLHNTIYDSKLDLLNMYLPARSPPILKASQLYDLLLICKLGRRTRLCKYVQARH